MSFFNDECDLAEDDQYDLFTSAIQVARRKDGRAQLCQRTRNYGDGTRLQGPLEIEMDAL